MLFVLITLASTWRDLYKEKNLHAQKIEDQERQGKNLSFCFYVRRF